VPSSLTRGQTGLAMKDHDLDHDHDHDHGLTKLDQPEVEGIIHTISVESLYSIQSCYITSRPSR